MSDFFVGQKVVCVDADGTYLMPSDFTDLTKGQIYVVRWVGKATYNGLEYTGLHVEGVRATGQSVAYRANRFRPLESKSIQLFRKIAQGVTEGKPIIADPEPVKRVLVPAERSEGGSP